jgi:hypothetical protein
MAVRPNVPSVNGVIVVLRRVKERIEASCDRLGLTYPWWIPAYSTLAFLALSVAAIAEPA